MSDPTSTHRTQPAEPSPSPTPPVDAVTGDAVTVGDPTVDAAAAAQASVAPPQPPRTIPPTAAPLVGSVPPSGPILPGPPPFIPPSGPILPGPPPLPPPPKRRRGPAKPPNPVVKTLFLVVGALFTITVLFWGTVSLVNVIGHVTEVQPVAFGSNVKAIVIRSGSGPISIRGADRSDISGQRMIEHGWQDPTLDEHMEGDTLVLDGRCAFAALVWCNVNYSLDVPRDIRIDAQTGAGTVNVTGMNADVEARSGAGTVDVSDLSGTLRLSSGAGSVRAARLTSTVVDAGSGAGSVHLEFLVPPDNVSVESGAGSVDVQVPADGTTYQVTGESGHGSRKIDVPTASTSTHTMHLQSGAGSTRLHLPS